MEAQQEKNKNVVPRGLGPKKTRSVHGFSLESHLVAFHKNADTIDDLQGENLMILLMLYFPEKHYFSFERRSSSIRQTDGRSILIPNWEIPENSNVV